MDYIAWLSLRAVQEPFTDFPARLREYEQLSGHRVDVARVRYYQVMAETKLLVMRHRPDNSGRSDRGVGGGDIGNGLIYGVLHRRLWFEAIAPFIDLDLEPPELAAPTPPSEQAWLYDALLTRLATSSCPASTIPWRDSAPRASPGSSSTCARSTTTARGTTQQLDDITQLLGARPPSLAMGRVAIADAARRGDLSDATYLRHQWRRVARTTSCSARHPVSSPTGIGRR